MRRLSAVLVIITLMTLLFAMQVYADPRYVPHEDPDEVEDFIDNPSLLLYYADVLNRIGEGDYDSAFDLINRLQYAHIPEEQRQLLDKYGGLINELPDILAVSREALNDASLLISQGRLDEAMAKLDEVQSIIDDMEALLADIEEDTERVGDAFDVIHALPNSLLFKAWETLQNSIDEIQAMEAEAIEMQTLLDSEITDIYAKDLKPTTLTLSLSPATAYVGDAVTASGSLSSAGKNLARKKVTIFIDGVNASVATTSSKGVFQIAIALPYEYVTSMTVMAQYTPIGRDINNYMPTISPTANITVDFYQTQVELDIPDEAYPGLPVAVRGEVLSEQPDGSNSRSVEIYLDSDLLGTASTTDGIFDMEYTIGVNTPPGQHNISAIVSPDGRSAGASYQKPITVTRAVPDIAIEAPSFVILPGKINITGNVSSELPMDGGTVSIGFGGKSVEADIQDDGRFSADLSLGFDWSLSGSNDLTVKVNTVEPWNDTAEVKIRIFTFNAVNVAVLAFCIAIIAVLGTAVYKRRKKRLLASETEQIAAAFKIDETESRAAVAKPAIVLEGNRAKLLDEYAKVARIIERTSSVKIEPDMTMREFLTAVKPKLRKAGDDFASLTAMAEKALYSQHETGEAEASAAQGLASTIREAI